MDILLKCKHCGIEFLRYSKEIERSQLRGAKNFYCSKKCLQNSNSFNFKQKHIENLNKRINEYLKNPKKCLNCNTIIPYKKRRDNKNYCSRKCSAIHSQKDGGHCKWSDADKQRIREQVKNNPYFNGTITPKKTGTNCQCLNCKNLFYKYKSSKQLCCSHKCYEQWAKQNGYLKGKSGGVREKSGRGKFGIYKGYYCQSSWELAWIIYNIDHDIPFTRNTQGFNYVFEGKNYKYYPDFIINNNEYVEIKGYMDEKNFKKLCTFPHTLHYIGKEQIKPYLDYVINKYGKNYIKLYE